MKAYLIVAGPAPSALNRVKSRGRPLVKGRPAHVIEQIEGDVLEVVDGARGVRIRFFRRRHAAQELPRPTRQLGAEIDATGIDDERAVDGDQVAGRLKLEDGPFARSHRDARADCVANPLERCVNQRPSPRPRGIDNGSFALHELGLSSCALDPQTVNNTVVGTG
jgi:hypothetical protein